MSSSSGGAEDCRDYLRTGRCKYGASCKYNHPANVQSGGGMKAPIHPGEPPFPLRPTEPICQYYMKHGSCKFGQACKFHHPPLLHQLHQQQQSPQFGGGGGAPSSSSLQLPPAALQAFVTTTHGRGGVSSSAPLLMSLGGTGGTPSHLLSTDNHHHQHHHHHPHGLSQHHSLSLGNTSLGNTDGGLGVGVGSSMILQFLPQRPDEPDCIYFLKNGRCKYGATCRYHHPIAYPSSNNASSARSRGPPPHHQNQHNHHQHHSQQPRGPPAVSYVSHVFPSSAYSTGDHNSGGAGGGNNTGPSSTSASPSFQPIPVVSMDGTQTFAYPLPDAHHHSSASSLASSYDTVSSTVDQGGDPTALAWNRARRNGSGGSLTAYGDPLPPLSSGGGGGGSASTAARGGGPPPKQPGSSTNNHSGLGGSGTSTTGMMHGSVSDPNIAAREHQRRIRSTSYGSTSDATSSSFSYYDATATAASTLSRTPSVGSWRIGSDATLESSARGSNKAVSAASSSYPGRPEVVAVSNHYHPSDFAGASTPPSAGSGRAVVVAGPPSSSSARSNLMMMMPTGSGNSSGTASRYRRSPRGSSGTTGRRENDEGFTMMTSALLNMLDAAPEELAGIGSYEDDEFDDNNNLHPGGGGDSRLYYDPVAVTSSFPSQHQSTKDPSSYTSSSSRANPDDEPLDPVFFERLSLHREEAVDASSRPPTDYHYSHGNGARNSQPHSWSPTLRRGNPDTKMMGSMGRSPNQEAALHHLLAQQHHHPQQQPYHDHHSAASAGGGGSNAYGGGDIGLYLP